MRNIHELSQKIFENLKYWVEKNSIYKPFVKQDVVDNKYPLVVFETNLNNVSSQTQDLYRMDKVRSLSFEISIFAIDDGNIKSGVICDEISHLVCEVMQEYYGMQGGIDAKLKNINTSQAQKYVLHFTCEWNSKQNIMY